MQISEVFRRLGYPKHTDEVYVAIVNSGSTMSVTQVAKTTTLSRVTVYRSLESLLKDKIIQSVQVGKRLQYKVGSAEVLEQVVQRNEQVSVGVVSKFTQKYKTKLPSSIRILTGPDGVREAFDDAIKRTTKGETFFRYTSELDLEKVNSYLSKNYRLNRDKKKLERMVISNTQSGKQKRSRLERFIKYIPDEIDQFNQNIIQLIYGDYVSIIDLSTEEVTIIENKQLADFQRVIFKLLYKRL
jgi:predicted transcriptional regulator